MTNKPDKNMPDKNMPDNRYLDEVLIGGIEKREIRVVDYDVNWPSVFQRHAAKIKEALGTAALRVEHIGSTSVQGLPAKPIIDILLIVEDSADERSYLPDLERAGYELRVREPLFHQHRMVRTPKKDVHIHVYTKNSPEIERYLIFRDRLRENASERTLYADTKRALAKRDWPHMDAYADAKTELIEAIIARGREQRRNDD